MRDRRVEVGCDRDRKLQLEEFAPEVVVLRRTDVRRAPASLRIADELDALLVQHVGDARHEDVGNVRVHDQRVGRVADAGPLRLGVHHDGQRVVEIGRRVHVYVAVAVTVDDHRDLGVLTHVLDERRTAAGNEAVDVLGELHHGGRRLVRGVLDEYHRIFRQRVLGKRVAQHLRDRDVRMQRRRRTAQQRRIAGLDAQARRVARDVRPVLVDDRHDAERHPDARDLKPVWPLRTVEHVADRVRQRRDGTQPVGHPVEACVGESQAVERPLRHPGGSRRIEVRVVRGPDLARPFEQDVGRGQQSAVLAREAHRGHLSDAVVAKHLGFAQTLKRVVRQGFALRDVFDSIGSLQPRKRNQQALRCIETFQDLVPPARPTYAHG